LELPATVMSGFCLLGILYFFLEVRAPAHCPASAHFFSEVSLLRCARGLGSGILRASARSKYSPFHPTGVWLFRNEFISLVGLLSRAPPDLDGDVRPGPP